MFHHVSLSLGSHKYIQLTTSMWLQNASILHHIAVQPKREAGFLRSSRLPVAPGKSSAWSPSVESVESQSSLVASCLLGACCLCLRQLGAFSRKFVGSGKLSDQHFRREEGREGREGGYREPTEATDRPTMKPSEHTEIWYEYTYILCIYIYIYKCNMYIYI